MRFNLYLCISGLMLASGIIASCGTNPSAQAEQTHASNIVLPTPPPMPTSLPVTPTPTPPPAPTQPIAVASAKLFSSAFDPGASLSGWTVIDMADALPGPSIWEIHDGYLTPASDASGVGGQYGTALIANNNLWSDYSVTVATYNIDNDEFGVIARANDQGFYLFELIPANNSTSAMIARYDAAKGLLRPLANTQIAKVTERQWLTLRIQVQGGQITGLLNGQTILQASDTTLSTGSAGVYGYAVGRLNFDNFLVQSASTQQ